MSRESRVCFIFGGLAALIFGVLFLFSGQGWAIAGFVVSAILTGFVVLFFRDPDRDIEKSENAILSPADGRVVFAGSVGKKMQDRKRIDIFLSLWDVHVNRIPLSGHVVRVEHHAGKFHPAFGKRSSRCNEHTVIGIQGRKGHVILRQIAGFVARRIVCEVKLHDRVEQGDRFGMIRFGSRMEISLPGEVELRISEGDRVKGGVTILGVFPGET